MSISFEKPHLIFTSALLLSVLTACGGGGGVSGGTGIGDTVAPTITVSESGGSGTITLNASAGDNAGGTGLAKVEWYIDGVLAATKSTNPYSTTLDSTTLTTGPHTLSGRAYDKADPANIGTSSEINFFVNNATFAVFQFGQANFNDILANRGGAPNNNTLSGPTSAATDGTNFYISDTNNNRVLIFNHVPTSSSDVAVGVIGQANLISNLPCVAASSGTCPTGLNKPSKVSIDSSTGSPRLLIVDSGNDRVLIWDTGALPTSNVAPTYVIGNGAGQPTAADTLSNPLGATFAGTKLVVADASNNRVLIYNTISTNAVANIVLGQRNFTSGKSTPNCPKDVVAIPDCTLDFAITPDSLSGPSDVWSNGATLVVSDQGNNRVLYFSQVPTSSQTAAVHVIGQAALSNRGAPGSGPSALKQPRGVWLDKNTSYIYVADSGNNRILVFNTPTANGSSAITVYGQTDYTHTTANDDDQDNAPDLDIHGNQQASRRTLNNPLGLITVVTPGLNRIYILDSGNARMTVYDGL